MFCFQCEQTAGCSGNAGVCGKSADAARLQDELTGALIGLARATDNAPDVNDGTWRLMIEGLFATVTNVSFDTAAIRALPRTDAAEIPIYALSADAFVEDERLSRQSGMNGHLAKPIDFDLLWQTIQGALHGKEQR